MRNKIILIVACLGLYSNMSVLAQGVIVHKSDGTKIDVPYSELDSITTYNIENSPSDGDTKIDASKLEGTWIHFSEEGYNEEEGYWYDEEIYPPEPDCTCSRYIITKLQNNIYSFQSQEFCDDGWDDDEAPKEVVLNGNIITIGTHEYKIIELSSMKFIFYSGDLSSDYEKQTYIRMTE